MILNETLRYLDARGAVTGRKLRAIYLNSYFTVVELDDGSVGAGMSYYTWPTPEAQALQEQLADLQAGDPLLLGWLFDEEMPAQCLPLPPDQAALLLSSLRVGVVSALSAPCLRAGGDETFSACCTRPSDPFSGATSALVIGFGGYMETLARAAHIAVLHISDLSYRSESAKMRATVEGFQRTHPNKKITISDGYDTAQRLREVDVVAITGSALCNGTLETLLYQARGGPRIVVQGQSASIHPVALFARGVQFVATTLKPPELARRAAAEPSGRSLRPLLEGGLPQLYCVPCDPRLTPPAAGMAAGEKSERR